MKVILLKDIKNLGLKGTIKEVNEGHFRNFLAPRQLAAPATDSKIKEIKVQKEKAVEKLGNMKESALSVKAKLEGQTLNITEKASEQGKLYAAVNAKEIAAAIKSQLKVDVPASQILVPSGLKETGDHEVEISLFKDISVTVLVHVTAQ